MTAALKSSQYIIIAAIGTLVHYICCQPLSATVSQFNAIGSPVHPISSTKLITNYLNTSNPTPFPGFAVSTHPIVYENVPAHHFDLKQYENITLKIFNVSGEEVLYDPEKYKRPRLRDDKSFLGVPWGKIWHRIWDNVGACAGNPCGSTCGVHDGAVWQSYDRRIISGIPARMSETLCGPGGISASYSKTWTYTVSIAAGPSLKLGLGVLDTVGIMPGYSYSWGGSRTVGYNIECSDGGNWPCTAVFTPQVAVLNGWARRVKINREGDRCSELSRDRRHVTVHVPIEFEHCDGSKENPCGPSGSWSHCFFTDKPTATTDCGSWNHLSRPRPVHRSCPQSVYKSFTASQPIWSW